MAAGDVGWCCCTRQPGLPLLQPWQQVPFSLQPFFHLFLKVLAEMLGGIRVDGLAGPVPAPGAPAQRWDGRGSPDRGPGAGMPALILQRHVHDH
jgi:hypothetical protein